ncbi:MAG: (2Fe-2S) ferredoxin domain-containing protein [Lachnospiraceae bacterium]|nr:(2Fe-2S) ferredoxin domain-containing protein [Lachnospiraceae bacterium]
MIELKVCVGSSCHVRGSYNVLQTFQQMVEEGQLHEKIEIKAAFCVKNCQAGVSITVNDTVYSVKPEQARSFFNETIMPLI